MIEERYVVAVRRSQRQLVPADWLERLRCTEGVSVVGASSGRAQIRADRDAVTRVRDQLGTFLHIEPVIEHRLSEPGVPPDDL